VNLASPVVAREPAPGTAPAATPAAPRGPLPTGSSQTCWRVRDYALDLTLTSGQVFGWQPGADGWTGVVAGRWIRLTGSETCLRAETARPERSWDWLADYLQVELDLATVLRTFPADPPLREAVRVCRGLRLLRQDPWECLASFLLSSTKQISQIRQVVAQLCERFGDEVHVPAGHPPAYAFPTPVRLARATEAQLRACRMGFRAPHLRQAARAVADGRLDLARLRERSLEEARAALQALAGVGPKIADCVLLFACGFTRAFPLDVWVQRALRTLYFGGRRVSTRRLAEFAANHFGPYAGYAQQYLFHYIRTSTGRP